MGLPFLPCGSVFSQHEVISRTAGFLLLTLFEAPLWPLFHRPLLLGSRREGPSTAWPAGAEMAVSLGAHSCTKPAGTGLEQVFVPEAGALQPECVRMRVRSANEAGLPGFDSFLVS